MRPPRPALPLVLLLALAPALEAWAAVAGTLPGLNFGHGRASALAYGLVAPWVAVLLSWRSPRARLAGYLFLAFDAVRSLRLGHPLPMALDVAGVLYLLSPPMRSLYPSMWSRMRARRGVSAS